MEKCRLTPEWYHREWDRIRTCAGRNTDGSSAGCDVVKPEVGAEL